MQISVNYRSHAGLVVSGLLLALCGEQAFAAGFAVRAQSASSIGTAGASDVAGTTDISAMFSNPAALSAFKGQQFSIGGAYVMPNAKFSNGKRTIGGTGIEAGTDDAGADANDDFTDPSFIPALYGTYEVNEDIVAGLSLTAPFGTQTDYGKDWVGRYHGTKTELEVINLDLAASYKVMDNLKLGFGIQVARANGVIEGASNFGAQYHQTVATSAANTAAGLVGNYYTKAAAYQADTGNTTKAAEFQAANTALQANALAVEFKTKTDAAIAGQTSGVSTIIQNTLSAAGTRYVVDQVAANEGRDDIFAQYKGNDISYGFTFGVLYSPLAELDLGFSYRSPIVHKTDGDFKLTGETAAADAYIASSLHASQKAKLTLPTPDIIGLGANYKGIENLQLYVSAQLTRWSRLKDFNVRPDEDEDVLVKLDWKDVWYAGVGAGYKFMPEFTLRGGLAMDNSPTTDTLRSPRSPDANRTFVSLGGRYEGEGWSADLGILHTIMKDPTLDLKNDEYPQANGRGDLSGDYKVTADTVMVQYNKTM